MGSRRHARCCGAAMQSTSMKRKASPLVRFGAALFVLAAAAGVTACGPVIVRGGSGGDGGSGGSGGGSGSAGGGQGGSAGGSEAIAIFASEIQSPPPGSGS